MNDKMITWDLHFNDDPWQREMYLKKSAMRSGCPLPGDMQVDEDLTLIPRVNHGRWIVDCPSQFCRGAELAREDGLFMCQSCFNASYGRKYLSVKFPRYRGSIEQVLSRRQNAENRNWSQGETITKLRVENKRFGVV